MGDPDDLEEIASASTCTPGSSGSSSDTVSVNPGVLDRLVQQLRGLKLCETSSPGFEAKHSLVETSEHHVPGKHVDHETREHPRIVVDLTVDDGDDTSCTSSSEPGGSRVDRIVEVLKRAKANRLNNGKVNVKESIEPVEPVNPKSVPIDAIEKNAYVLPDHVSSSCLNFCDVSFPWLTVPKKKTYFL